MTEGKYIKFKRIENENIPKQVDEMDECFEPCRSYLYELVKDKNDDDLVYLPPVEKLEVEVIHNPLEKLEQDPGDNYFEELEAESLKIMILNKNK